MGPLSQDFSAGEGVSGLPLGHLESFFGKYAAELTGYRVAMLPNFPQYTGQFPLQSIATPQISVVLLIKGLA